jgi:hypothetical protein
MIGPPRVTKSQNGFAYIFTISGIIYFYFVSPGCISKGLEPFTLKSSNELYLFHIPKEISADVLLKLFEIV